MLTLVTGLPGNGKTLHTLWLIHRKAKAEGRPVFYHGIELTDRGREVLGWQVLDDPLKWYELPPLSLVVIDEAQHHWRVRPQGSTVPESVKKFEIHRHGGIDVYLLTQHPHLIDTNLRKLTGRHLHMLRPFGLSKVNVYQWEGCQADPVKELKRGMRTTWPLATDYYPLYKSAEVHTVKKDFPLRYIAMVVGAAAVVLGGLGYVYWHFTHGGGIEGLQSSVEVLTDAAGRPVGPVVRDRAPYNPWDAALRSPRVPATPASAPFFDTLEARPASSPRIAGCISNGPSDCSCHTWQGSRLEIGPHECRRLFKMGWFDPQRAYIDSRAENVAYLNATRSATGPGASSSSTGESPSMGSVGGVAPTPSGGS